MGEGGSEPLGRMLIFSLVFITTFIALLSLVPIDFYVSSKTYTQFTVPDYFTQADIQNIKHFLNYSIPSGYQTVFNFNLASNPVNVKINIRWLPLTNAIIADHVTWEFWFIQTLERQTFSNFQSGFDYGLALEKNEAIEAWNSASNASIFTSTSSQVTEKIWVFDSNQTRNNLSQAWDANELAMGIGFGFDDYKTKLNAWDIVGKLLTFQSPQIFGFSGATATLLNLVFAMPFWACVAYLVYRLIIMAIPFV